MQSKGGKDMCTFTFHKLLAEIVLSMDSEWDQKVARVLVGA